MKKLDYCFLILHYKDAAMTEQTISSILLLKSLKSYRIVIIDNASPDQSGDILRKKYKDCDNICLLQMEENGGFSKGNNFGYRYIKENFLPRFLICVNNDVLFIQTDFLDKLEHLYMKIPFYVCGPDIYIPWRDFHSNPLSNKANEYTLNDVEKEIERIERLINTCQKCFTFKTFKLYLIQKARKWKMMQKTYKIVRRLQNKSNYKNLQENVILRGACLIFDKRFIDEADQLFEPETFLYGEEHLLDIRCQRNNWNTVYSPEIFVNHLHEGNSNLGELSYSEYRNYLLKRAGYEKEALVVCKDYIKGK